MESLQKKEINFENWGRKVRRKWWPSKIVQAARLQLTLSLPPSL